MRKLQIKFVDFWFGFAPKDNYFFKLLNSFYDVELSDEPDFIIYSCYGKQYLKYNCLRVFYTSESLRPDYSCCDFAITFDYSKDDRHFRFPLYGIYIDQAGSIEQLKRKKTREEALNIWRSKTKFCCLVVSNAVPQKRLQFFKYLCSYKAVDSGGTVLNNVGGPVKDKMEFIKDYKFVIAFENRSYPGYTTEKIVEPFLANSIPLYWGNNLVSNDFNTTSFLNMHDFESLETFVDQITAIDNNEELAVDMLMQPVFRDDIIPNEIDKEKFLEFFHKVVEKLSTDYKPVAVTWRRYIHKLSCFKEKYRSSFLYYLNQIKIYNRKH